MAREVESAARAAVTAEGSAGAPIAGEPGIGARLFSPAGACLSRDGSEVRGRGQIGVLLSQLTDSEHRLGVELGRTLLGGGVALCTQSWTRPRARGGAKASRRPAPRGWCWGRAAGWDILIVDPWG